MTETATTTAPIACSLTAEELGDRIASLRALGDHLEGVEAAGVSATFRFSGDRESVDAFVEAEQRCCAFFEFDVRSDGELVRLEVGAPAGAEPFVRALVAAVVGGWEGALG